MSEDLLNRAFDLTLEQQTAIMAEMLDELELTVSLGEMWIQKKSDVSYIASRALGALSSCHKLATAALSQLRYWTANNGYASTLTTRQVLTSWCGGSAMLTELISYVYQCVFWEDIFETVVPELTAEVAAFYLD